MMKRKSKLPEEVQKRMRKMMRKKFRLKKSPENVIGLHVEHRRIIIDVLHPQ